jgi:hypothetical protein
VDASHIGAFLSGIAAVLSSMYALRTARRRAEQDCERRIQEVRAAIREGYELRDHE